MRSSGAQVTRRSVLSCALLILFPAAWAQDPAAPSVNLRVESDGDELKFVPNRLSCKAGARVRLQFHHAGRISSEPHDWVLLKAGTAEAFIRDTDRQADDHVVPLGDQADVIAATPFCARGKTVKVDFTAPVAGDYPFVCSVPGHGMVMRGVLTVLAT